MVVIAVIAAHSSHRAYAANAHVDVGTAAPCAAAGLAQQAVHHAGLIIVFPEGRIETRCVEFSEDSISGTQLLQESGLPIVFSSFGGGLGAGVCRIDDVGCSDPGNCFCQCQGASCAFWSYFKLDGSTWRYESVGPATRRLHDGDTDAWVWGSGHAGPGDARAPCPATPAPALRTPTVLAASTPVSPNDGSDAPPTARQAAATAKTAAPPTIQSAAAPVGATETPAPRVVAQPEGGNTNLSTAKHEDSGGGAPAGLIAFGVSAGVLGVVIGGIFLRRRLGG